MSGLRSRLRGFRRDTRGAYALDFALLALPFFGLIGAFAEVAWINYNSEQLQAAVDRAARQVMTGRAPAANSATATAFVANLLCPTDGTRLLPASWDCTKLFVDARIADSFTAADMTNTFYTGKLSYCIGTPGKIVVLRVVYPLPSIFPLSIYNQYVGLANNVPNVSGWRHILMGSAVFKTEAFKSSAPTC